MTAASLALLLLSAPAAAARAPNVVVIDVCSARVDRFGVYGSTAALTPGLDAFARDATVFDRAWAQASWCLPNYATLLTGLRPEAHGRHVNRLDGGDPRHATLAERLRAAGYRTGGFTGGVYLLPAWGLTRGFDRYHSAFSSSSAQPENFAALRPAIDRWLDESSTRPFFLYTTVDDLHAPYADAPATAGGVAVSSSAADVRFFRAYNGETAAPPIAAAAARAKADPGYLAGLGARYDAAVGAMDRDVAAFLDSLKRRGLWEDTVVIVTADHGEMLGENGLLGHTEGLYEPVLRVPLFVRHPKVSASRGRRVSALVERADLAPTVLDLAGAPDAALPGASLVPLLRDPAAAWRAHAYASSQRNTSADAARFLDERAITDGRWKLHWYAYKKAYELYDLARDPGETRDLAAERPDVVSRLAFELQRAAEAARRSGERDAAPTLSPTAPRD